MKKHLTDALSPGMRVFTPTMSNESALLSQELTDRPEAARGVEFCGVQFPGIDKTDYLAIHPESRQTGYFMSTAMRVGLATGRASLLSLDYLGIAHHLLHSEPMDLAIAQVSEPDADGWCAPGLSCDFMPLVWPRARRRIAHINPRMPRIASGFRIHMSQLHGNVVCEKPLLDFNDPHTGELEVRIASLVSSLVRDGDTLQFGIGSLPLAIGGSLTGHRNLRFHGGLVSSALQTLWDAGALDRDARVTTGVVLGNQDFRDFAADLKNLWLAPVTETHSLAHMVKITRLIAINSAVEVDLFGQVNSERANGVLAAGAGGLPAFAQGVLASPGGRLLICLASTTRKNNVSRIVPALGADAICTVPRYLVDTVITEHGIAEIRGLSLHERAQALISIAAPEHREPLNQAWSAMRNTL
jgi:acyl-CoA hydrolase